MKIILTNHAKQRMSERAIKMQDLKETIDMPDYTIKNNGVIEAYKKLDNKTLKIVYSKGDSFIKIITVIEK
tara:strand:+ start:473 stop:685 length:213 start_codon:yes stop_codon:yes gene_type:complete